MTSLTIRHVTTCRYRQPVASGEYRMMLRPRESYDQEIIEASLGITPEPSAASAPLGMKVHVSVTSGGAI